MGGIPIGAGLVERPWLQGRVQGVRVGWQFHRGGKGQRWSKFCNWCFIFVSHGVFRGGGGGAPWLQGRVAGVGGSVGSCTGGARAWVPRASVLGVGGRGTGFRDGANFATGVLFG